VGAPPSPIVTFTSDFGSFDEYVGVMKGEVLRRCRDAVLVDLSHDIDAGDVLRGALILEAAVSHFPPGTIHVAVVDPEVGSSRNPLLVDCGDYILVGPDNGLLCAAMTDDAKVYILDQSEFFLPHVSSTFHGRDLFAPIAGHLASGRLPAELGSVTTDLCKIAISAVQSVEDGAVGEILYADRFGNLVTNIARGDLPAIPSSLTVTVGDVEIGEIRRTYSDGDSASLIALFGSDDRLEIAVVGGSAAARFGSRAARGTRVQVGAPLPRS
jgi:S-adenosylmethionine hydrolase